MDLLEKFDTKEVDFIIKNGIVLFENSKKYFKSNMTSIDDYKQSNHGFLISEKEKLIDDLQKEKADYEARCVEIQRKCEDNRKTDKIYFMKQIDE